MLEALRKTLANNARYVAGGAAALLLAGGGTATTISLSGNSTPTPASHPDSTSKVEAPDTEAPDVEAPDTEAPDTSKATDASGSRPADTHGYCVSHAVAAAHVAGLTGADVAKAAHSCPTPGKSGTHGKSASTHGKSAATRP